MGFGVPSGLAAAVALWKPSGALRADRRGSFAIITAMLGVVLIGTAALAIDVGNWQVNKSAMQGAADQAALAAGFAMPNGTAPAQNEAKGVAAANGFANGQGGVTVTVATPPSSGSHAGAANAIQVTIAQPQQRFLSSVVLNTAPTISATAVSAAPPANTCIMALAATGAGITANGSGTIGADNCDIYVNSSDNCDVTSSGVSVSGYDVFLSTKTMPSCLSSASITSTHTPTHTPTLGATPAVDPYASNTIPTPTPPCKTVSTSSTTVHLTPGTYCSLAFSSPQNGSLQTVTLDPGLYVFDGGNLSVSGNVVINGTGGVTLVFTSSGSSYGGIMISGTVTLNLNAMTSGATAGMAIWIDGRGRAAFLLSGTNILNIQGAVYAPRSAVAWSGGASSPCTQLIASTITFNGTANFQHKCAGIPVKDVPGVGAGNYTLVE